MLDNVSIERELTFLIFGVLIVLQNVIPNGPIANVTIHSIVCGCSGIFAMLVAYIAGRLDKIEKNVLLMIIALVLIIVCSVLLIISYDNFNFMRSLSHLTQPICFSSLCFAYTSRYDEHKLVGLE